MKYILIALLALMACSKPRDDSSTGQACGRVVILYDWFIAKDWNDTASWVPTGRIDTGYDQRTCDQEFLARMRVYPHIQFVCVNDWRKERVEVLPY